MDTHSLYEIVETFFGYKADMLYVNTNENEVACMLYNSFLFKCNLDERYNTFGAGIVCGKQEANITEFLGETCSLNSDEQSIKESLKIVGDYCRLRLPDKFLNAFEEAYSNR